MHHMEAMAGFAEHFGEEAIQAAAAGTAAKPATPAGRAAKPATGKSHRSALDLGKDLLGIAADFGGETVRLVVEEILDHIDQTSMLLGTLASMEMVDTANFFLLSTVKSLPEASRKIASENDLSETIQGSDFGEFLETFKTILMKRCRGMAGFSPMLLPHIESLLPMILQSATEMYGNIVSSTGFGLTFGMLNQATSMLSLLERPEYISRDTFKGFADFPTEMKLQLETAVDELLNRYIDPAQLEMMLGMAKMYASNFASSRRAEHDEL